LKTGESSGDWEPGVGTPEHTAEVETQEQIAEAGTQEQTAAVGDDWEKEGAEVEQ